MNKSFSIVFVMFACVFIPIIIIYGVASFYGGDWDWIASQLVQYYLVLTVLGLALFTLVALLRRR